MTSIPIRARPAQASVGQVAPALDLATAFRWLGLDAPAAGSPGQPIASLATLVTPPAACPGCTARRGRPWPGATTTSRFCARCRAVLRRSAHAAPSAHSQQRSAQ